MQAAKFIDFFKRPLEDLDPSAGPCVTKSGKKQLKNNTLKTSAAI